VLEVSLTLGHERDFSFSRHPCLNVENSVALCPYEVGFSAVGLFQDDGSMYDDKQKRWNTISNFHGPNNWILSLPSEIEGDRIGRQLVYQHYGYSGEPEFGFFRVNLSYKYRCVDSCPEKLTLDTGGLTLIEGLSIATATVNFEKTRESEYRATSPIQ
jgi:hypothetical protein